MLAKYELPGSRKRRGPPQPRLDLLHGAMITTHTRKRYSADCSRLAQAAWYSRLAHYFAPALACMHRMLMCMPAPCMHAMPCCCMPCHCRHQPMHPPCDDDSRRPILGPAQLPRQTLARGRQRGTLHGPLRMSQARRLQSGAGQCCCCWCCMVLQAGGVACSLGCCRMVLHAWSRAGWRGEAMITNLHPLRVEGVISSVDSHYT